MERKMTCKNRNILLLLGQCSSHNPKGLALKQVQAMHLLWNSTSYMQPLCQGLIFCLKCTCWTHLVHSLVRVIERNAPITELRGWNIMDAMRGVAVALESITSRIIQKCFFKMWLLYQGCC